MKNHSWIILPIAFLAGSALAIGACGGGDGGEGGNGGNGTSSSTGIKPATVASSVSSTVASTSGGFITCEGVFMGDCDACAVANCCVEVDACYDDVTCLSCLKGEETDPTVCAGSQALNDALVQCLQASACSACFPDDECNPVTNEPCDTAGGQACDLAQGGFYACFGPPNTIDLCGTCPSGSAYCKPGMHCMTGNKCATYCCDDADCNLPGETGNTCSKEELGDPNGPVGICVDASAAAACNVPAPLSQPSMGSCLMLPP